MSSPITSTPTGTAASSSGSGSTPAPTAAGSGLGSRQGKTTVADAVVAKVAAIAAREVPGVHGFGGGGAARAFGSITERIPGGRASSTQGVSVEVGERQAAVDLAVVVEYGVAVAEVSRAIRRDVIAAIGRMIGLEVVEVNITVVDLHLPTEGDGQTDGDQAPARPTTRVQ